MPPVKKTKPKTEPKKAKANPKARAEREVLYPQIEVHIRKEGYEGPLTVQDCKDLLGWEEEEKGEDTPKFGTNYLLLDRTNTKIRCTKNMGNRPLYMGNVEDLVQEHLNRRWRFNCETIVIGKTGLVCNGQHSLISAVLAEQDRTGKNSAHYHELWPDEITMEKLVVLGADEDDEVINTMDTAKPRSLMDVLYRSPYFKDRTDADRRKAARYADHAIRLLWRRTGMQTSGFAKRRTHSESLAFINTHPHLLDAIGHVMACDGEQLLKTYIAPGQAAAVLFLMGCSEGDGEDYHNELHQGEASEKSLDWTWWDKALDFWTLFCKMKVSDLQVVREGFGQLATEESNGSLAEKLCVLAKAWAKFKADEDMVKDDLLVERTIDPDDGKLWMDDDANFGGIDLGEPSRKKKTVAAQELDDEEFGELEDKDEDQEAEDEAFKMDDELPVDEDTEPEPEPVPVKKAGKKGTGKPKIINPDF